MSVTVIIGEQRGDEGKGRFVDMESPNFDFVARYNGGPNAGHTVVTPDNTVFKLHLVPSGIVQDHAVNIIGNGTFVDPVKLDEEIKGIEEKGVQVSPRNLRISSAAHLILPHHISSDEIREAGKSAQGSTKSGIAQVAASRGERSGMRAEIIKNDLSGLEELVLGALYEQRKLREAAELPQLDEIEIAKHYVAAAKKLSEHITDTSLVLNEALQAGKNVLAEGAQAFLLDIDHGMYPYVTSSSTGSAGAALGLGIPPMQIDRVVGVVKATQSHVGGGPFVTEVREPELLERLHGDESAIDAEKGTTTGRKRRLGHLDLPVLRRSQMINGTTERVLTKLDWLPRYGEKILICVEYERKGKRLSIAPDAAYKLEGCNPIYEELDGWTTDISGARSFDELPTAAQRYVRYIEDQTGVPIKRIGVGPKRDQVIVR